eukprot:scaffold666839_cov48-Prasinocladus_malaysianus.AAC.2
MATNLPNCTVVMTEQAEGGAVEHLLANIEKNCALVGDRCTACLDVAVFRCKGGHFDLSFDWKSALCRVEACVLDWRECSSRAAGPKVVGGTAGTSDTSISDSSEQIRLWGQSFDLVVGSDLVYNDIGSKLLPLVMRRFASNGAVILYGHTLGRFEILDKEFQDNLQRQGLVARMMNERGQEQLHSPEEDYLSDLFPELRPVIFLIHLP